ncbi:MAG: hypothetical protein KJ955_03705 [Nanoarchaeota archaeon]|nr:hypothetical protein [Nanoarchaeota archaeon]
MADAVNITIGIGVIVLNLIPFVLKKPKLLFLTALLSLLMLFALSTFR